MKKNVFDCHSTKKAKLDYQKNHRPDFTAKDLWSHIAMNNAGVFVYGFDDEEEAKAYAKYMKKHRRPVTLVPLDEALKMPLPPTWEHNWDYDKKWEFPAELENKFGQKGDILVSDNAVVIR